MNKLLHDLRDGLLQISQESLNEIFPGLNFHAAKNVQSNVTALKID